MTFDRRFNAPPTAEARRFRRDLKSRTALVPAVLGKGDGSTPLVGKGKIWVRRSSSKDANGDIQYGPPEKINAGVADYWIDEGTKVFIAKDGYYGDWEVVRADLRDAEAKGRNSVALNTGLPQNKYIRLKNAVRLICRPVGGNPDNSTLVGVRGLLYDDNYYDLNRFAATGRISDMLDLASDVPVAGKQAVVIVWLDTFNNTLVTTSSTVQNLDVDIDLTDYQEAIDSRAADTIPIQAFHLSDGQTNITNAHLGEDLRQFINLPPAVGNEYELTVNQRVRNKRQYLIAGAFTVPVGKTMTIESGGELSVIGAAAGRSYQTITSNLTMTGDEDVILGNCTSGNITITLPALASFDGRTYTIKHVGTANKIILDGNASETIDGALTQDILFQYDSIDLIATSTEWRII